MIVEARASGKGKARSRYNGVKKLVLQAENEDPKEVAILSVLYELFDDPIEEHDGEKWVDLFVEKVNLKLQLQEASHAVQEPTA